MQIEDQVRDIVTPLLSDLSINLWDVEWKDSRLRILVDTAQGIDTETLGLASRILSSELDKSAPLMDDMLDNYTLEVSSPGLDRTLRHQEHFQSFIGKEISVKLNSPINQEWRITGTLSSADSAGIEIKAEKIPYTEIKKAQTVFKWGEELDGVKNGSVANG